MRQEDGVSVDTAEPFPRCCRARVRCLSALLLGSTIALAVELAPAEASAAEPELTSETAAQFYEMRSPTGETVVSRRRLMTTLGVSVYDLYDKAEDPSAPTLSFWRTSSDAMTFKCSPRPRPCFPSCNSSFDSQT